MGRAQHVEYGRSSETLSSLGLDPMPDADAPDDILDGFLDGILAGGDAPDGSDATGTTGDRGDADGADATGDRGDGGVADATGGNGKEGQRESGRWPHGRETI